MHAGGFKSTEVAWRAAELALCYLSPLNTAIWAKRTSEVLVLKGMGP